MPEGEDGGFENDTAARTVGCRDELLAAWISVTVPYASCRLFSCYQQPDVTYRRYSTSQ